MRGHGCKLPRLLRKAVEAYLEERTVTRAAQRTPIARSTLYVWMRLAEFQQLCNQIRRARLLEGIRLFQAQAASADLESTCGVSRSEIDRAIG